MANFENLEIQESDWQDFVDTIVLLLAGSAEDKDYSSGYILAREIEEQLSLIKDGHYASAVIRQSTFYETLLTGNIMEKLEEMNNRKLYNSEKDFIENLGHTNRIQLAHLLGVIDQRERDILLNMASWRNNVAHKWWFVEERKNKDELHDVATTVVDLLTESMAELVEEADEDSVLTSIMDREKDD